MTPKERAAMQQALEALEVYGEHAKDCPQYPTYTRPQDYPKCDCGFEEAIAALREALVEQAEQEPVAWYAEDNLEERDEIEVIWTRSKPQYAEVWKPLYAAPVRTKDLTDEFIYGLADSLETFDEDAQRWILDSNTFARAVIAADREKNK